MLDFGAKRIFLRAASDFAELPWPVKREEPPSSHPDGSK
jgi:hypothetical protein